MTSFTLHTLETAPEESKPLLEKSVKSFGMVPNLCAVQAEAPGILEAYLTLNDLFSKSSFDEEELTVVWQTINVEHECLYCVPAHTLVANSMGVSEVLTNALRKGEPMPDDKLQVLHDTTLEMVRSRGRLTVGQMERFFAVGYGKRQLLEIVLGLSQKVISNYTNHLAKTPIDASFAEFSWQKGS